MQIGEVASFQNGYAFKSKDFVQDGKYKIIKIKELKDGKVRFFNDSASVNVDDERIIEKYIAEKGDVLFALTGDPVNKNNPLSWVGRVSVYEDDQLALLNQRVCKLVPKEGLNAKYIYYYFRAFDNFYALASIAKGSASQANISTKDIEAMEIALPSLNIQNKIVSVLDSIEEKINQNNAINKNLEQQAKAVFKSWFEDFDPFDEPLIETPAGIYAPASLQMVQIANIPHVLETGKRPKGGAVASGVPSIGAENVKQLGVVNFSSAKFIPEEFAAKMKTGAINGYELLLYKDGGKPGTFIPHFSMFGEGFPYQKFFINEHVFKLDFGDKGFNEFAYFFMQTDYAYHWLASNGGKAAVPGINQQNVKDIWIFSPENSKVKEFGEWVQPLFTTILKNCAENVKLAELRDTLLPKLMSGELDVSDIEI